MVSRESSSLHHDVSQSLTVWHIQTSADKVTGFAPDERADAAADLLAENRFDYGPVFGPDGWIGRVALSDLRATQGQVADSLQTLNARYLVTANSPLTSIMRWLAADPWLVVMQGRAISGIVTPSDLNKQAARTYFYVLVADFEIRLADAIREHFSDPEEPMNLLASRDRKYVEGFLKKAQAGDIDSDPVSTMSMRHLLSIARKTPDLRRRLTQMQPEDWAWAEGHLPSLRDQVAHPGKQLLDDATGLDRLIEMDEHLSRLADGTALTSPRSPESVTGTL